MKRLVTAMLHTAGVLCCLAMCTVPDAIAGDKPLLSEEIRQVIDTRGTEAARKRFAEIYPSRKDEYTIDMQDFAQLSSEYVQAGNMEAAGVLMEMVTPLMQDIMATSMNAQSGALAQQMAAAQRAEEARQVTNREAEQRLQEEVTDRQRGRSRDDLGRFTGLYGDPAEGNETRRIWVMVSCDGHLVSGALWGDASPWWMRSAADRVFTYSDSFTSFSMEFETGADGKASRMIHELEFMKSPLERLGPIPDDWGSCLKSERG